MKKIPSIFVRDWVGDRSRVTREHNPECAWVFAGEGRATRKFDGTACLWHDGRLWKRYDVKKGRAAPSDFVPAQEPDATTGHWTGWLPVGDGPEDKWHRAAVLVELGDEAPVFREGATYELIGPKIQANAEHRPQHELWRHGMISVMASRDYDALIAAFAEGPPIEGVVWHHPDGRMAKIKRRDFGLLWPCADKV